MLVLFSLVLAGAQNPTYCNSGHLPDARNEQSDLHLRCVQVGKPAEGDITDMVPHRVWTWRLNFEKSKQKLDQLRRDLDELWTAEDKFVASLDSEQRSKVRSRLESLQTRTHGIEDIWNQLDYLAFRRRIQTFDFSPCIVCGGCELFESNQEDCIGSPVPACGGCLWAQGIIRCP